MKCVPSNLSLLNIDIHLCVLHIQQHVYKIKSYCIDYFDEKLILLGFPCK